MVVNAREIVVEKRDQYIFVALPGYETVARTKYHISELYDVVVRCGTAKVLIDWRATREPIPVFELYELCMHLVDKFGLQDTKLAIMALPEATYPDRFGENVVQNRGVDLIRFTSDEKEALAWLL